MAREERLQGSAQAGQRTLNLAREATIQQQHSMSRTRDFLSELAHYRELDYPKAKACPALLAKKLREHPEYANVFVATLDGELVCSALPFEERLNVSDRAYFQLAVAGKSFSVGEYQVGRLTGKATLAFGHPMLDETGKFTAVLAASLDLAHFSDLIKDARLPKGSALLLIDSKGTVLVHHPDPQRIVGKSMTDQPLVRRLLSSNGEEVDQEVGLDGVRRLYAFAPIRAGGDTRAYLGMGIPIEVAFADANRTLRRNLVLLGLVTLLALGAAWFGGDLFILGRVNDLVNATRRLATGDQNARTTLPYGKSELGQLARAFDGMAESLQRRQAEVERAQESIRLSEQRFRLMVENVKDYALFMLDSDGHVISWNVGAERINGYQAKEIIGKYFSRFYLPEDIAQGMPEHGLKVALTEGRFENEEWRLRKDGSQFWANVVITAVRDDGGHLIGFSKVMRDLTERKQAEQDLHGRYQELQILYQIGQTVLTAPDLQTALEKILDEAIAVDSFDLGTILLVDPSGRKIEAAASRGYRDPANIKRRPTQEVPGRTQYRAHPYQKMSVVENVVETEGLRTLKREGVESAVLTPVRAGEKTLGILQVGSRTRRRFDADKVRLLEAIGNEMGVAIQKSRFYEEAKHNLDRIHALYDIDLAITSSLNLQTILDVLLEKIDLLTPYPSATTVRLLNKETGEFEFLACRNIDEDEWKSQFTVAPKGRALRVLETKRPFIIRNVQTDPRINNPCFYRNNGLISYIGVPLIVKDNALGVLSVYTKEEHEFSEEETQFFVTLAGQAAIAIYNSQLYTNIQRREAHIQEVHKQLQALYAVTSTVSQSLDLEIVLNEVIGKVTEIFKFDATRIFLFDPRMQTLLSRAFYATSPKSFNTESRFRRSQGIVGTVAERGEPVILEDILTDPRYQEISHWGNIKKAGFRFFAAFPIKSKLQTIGVIAFFQYNPRSIGPSEIELLTAMTRQIGIAVENARLFEDTSKRADELTLKTLELERSNKVKDEFLSVISHELRTPLNIMIGYTRLLREGLFGGLNPEQGDALKKIKNQSTQLLSIVTNILQVTQIETAQTKPAMAKVNLGEFIDEIKTAYDLPVNEELIMNWSYPSDLPAVETDSEKLKCILGNLINNAIKFTPRGQVSILARMKEGEESQFTENSSQGTDGAARTSARQVEFKVADTGVGIAKKSLTTIFDKFRQADNSETRLYGGTGLGLYIVKKYTELLGGKVQVESEVGRGSTFTVTIPYHASMVTPIKSTAGRKKEKSIELALQG